MKLIDLNTVPQEKPRETVIGPYTDPKEFLQQVMAAVELPLSQRMRAGIELLPYIHPRLAVTALVNEQSFAELFERRLKRIDQMTNGNGKAAVEVKPYVNPQPIEHRPIEAPKPLPRIADRRFRRM